jgi:3D (Asp-Asp-Asp) domain-containing protein
MRKYFIFTLLIALLVTVGVYKVQSQIEKQNENINNEITNTNKIADINNQDVNENIYVKEPVENLEPIMMKATAYTKSKSEGTYKGITKSGVRVSRGMVAVDPNRIPLGTKLYVEGYGHAIACDIGGDIKHDRIDLYMDTKKEAFEFGRQNVRVWILSNK